MADLIPSSAPAAPAPSAPSPSPAPAPAPSAPSPAPSAPAPKADSDSGNRGMKDFISGMTKKPEPKPADATPAPTPEPKAPSAATDEPVVDVTDAIWDKAPKNLKNAHFKLRRELQEKLTANESRLKELESKPNQSPADLKRIQELEGRIATQEKALESSEQRVIQSDYRNSKEFEEKYVKNGEKAYQQAIGDVKRLQVNLTDADGNVTSRPATENDFNLLRSLPPFDQDKKINEMFGTSAWRVSNHMRTLEALEQEANEAISTARTKADENRRTHEQEATKRSAEFKTHSDRVSDELVKTHAAYFAPDPANPEATAALERGLKYVDDSALNHSKMNAQELAETTAMIRFLAGSAPRLMTEIKQLRDQLAKRDEELGKYRKSSPGGAPSAPGGGGPKAPEPEKRGLAAIKEMMVGSVKR